MLLTENKPTSITFDLSIDGTKSTPSSVRLQLGQNPAIVYEARQQDGKWTCDFTPPASLGTDFPVSIEVVVNGSVFTPYKSTATFKALEAVSVSNIQEAHKPVEQPAPTRIENVLRELNLKPQPKQTVAQPTVPKLQLPERTKLGQGLREGRAASTSVGIKFTKGTVIYK
jgi:signal recognition particle subunit SEC65